MVQSLDGWRLSCRIPTICRPIYTGPTILAKVKNPDPEGQDSINNLNQPAGRIDRPNPVFHGQDNCIFYWPMPPREIIQTTKPKLT